MQSRLMVIALGVALLAIGTLTGYSLLDTKSTSLLPPIKVSVVFEGVTYAPGDFDAIRSDFRQRGTPLIFLVADDGLKNRFLYAFRSKDDFEKFYAERGKPVPTLSGQNAENPIVISGPFLMATKHKNGHPLARHPELSMLTCGSPDQSNRLYEHVDCGGSHISSGHGVSVPDLRNVGDDWNDRISSVVAASLGSVVLYWDIEYEGEQLVIGSAETRVNLGWYGWNDEASSYQTGYPTR